MNIVLRCMLVLFLVLNPPVSAGDQSSEWELQISTGVALRMQGELRQAINTLSAVSQTANSPAIQAAAAGELGITLLQAHQKIQAEPPLKQAYEYFSGEQRGRYAVYLGNLNLIRNRKQEAENYYQEALALAGKDSEIRMMVSLNRIRLLPKEKRPAQIKKLSDELDRLEDLRRPANLHINLGNLAHQSAQIPLAYHHLKTARELAENNQDRRLQIEAIDALAQLYEEQKRAQDALNLTRQGIAVAQALDHNRAADLLINLEWRQGRLLKAGGNKVAALAAHLRAVELIESIRQDIPIEFENGESSFRTLLEPIYLSYADLLLQQADSQPASGRADQLRAAIDTIELIKQSELQDFLGDRCAVEAVQGGSSGRIPANTAALYPLLLPDRIELLLETASGIQRRTVNVTVGAIRLDAVQFAAMLRNGIGNYMPLAQQLYRQLLAPFETSFAEQKITSLIVVPDGVLRLVPIGALHDGKQFAIDKFAISMATGLSMTNSAPPTRRAFSSLIAGVSEPGAVVEKLSRVMTAQIFEPGATADDTAKRGLATSRNLRAIRPPDSHNLTRAKPDSPGYDMREIEDLKSRLALPGVKDEIRSLRDILEGTSLLNQDFTVGRFINEGESGEYQIVHIASHGVFGGSSDTSFIMAHDDILSMDALQVMLRAEKFQKNPIELLSLSACQTAEGNDRSPLGISGAAIKARAKSVLGTLWPVEDNAARSIMESLYSGLTVGKLSKTEALRQAQINLIRSPETAHPFFWAPFVLIGNWQ